MYLILQSLFSMFLTLTSAVPKTTTDALMHPQQPDDFPEWPPVCIGPMLPEHGVHGIRNYHFSAAQHQDQWAEINHDPAITTLTAFCTNNGRGADCACVNVDENDLVLNCNGYLGAYPALEHCFRRCECGNGAPLGRRRQGVLEVMTMAVGRTVVNVS